MFRAEGLQPPSRISISALAKWCPAQLDREASNDNQSLARVGEVQPMDIHSAECRYITHLYIYIYIYIPRGKDKRKKVRQKCRQTSNIFLKNSHIELLLTSPCACPSHKTVVSALGRGIFLPQFVPVSSHAFRLRRLARTVVPLLGRSIFIGILAKNQNGFCEVSIRISIVQAHARCLSRS